MSNTFLITVSDDRFGRKQGGYRETQNLINELTWNWPISKHFGYTFEDIKRLPTYTANKKLLDNIDPARNGRAYKPIAIYNALTQISFGDYLIYNDCSPELWRTPFAPGQPLQAKYDLNVLRRLVDNNNDILTTFVKWDTAREYTNGLGIHTHANFTTDRCISRMGLWNHRHDFQHASGLVVIRKTAETQEFVREWQHWNTIDECCALGWAHIEDNYDFWNAELGVKMGHRHDQSISGLLLNKRGAMLADMPPHDDVSPFNFTQFCRTDWDYKFISSINPHKPEEQEIIVGSTVMNTEGTFVTVYRFEEKDGERMAAVGKHVSSCYLSSLQNLKLIKQ
jgi:hypothetical protein